MTLQPRLGILMLDTRFPRIPGDPDTPDSYAFPVKTRRLPGATRNAIMSGDPRFWLETLIDEGKSLAQSGCTGLALTSDVLSQFRDDLARACGLPVASSALEQAPVLAACLPAAKPIGVLSVLEESVTPARLRASGMDPRSPTAALDGTYFADAILSDLSQIDTDQVHADIVAAARELCSDAPRIAAIVLETAHMAPYAADIAAATHRPVFSLLTYLKWFHEGLQPPPQP